MTYERKKVDANPGVDTPGKEFRAVIPPHLWTQLPRSFREILIESDENTPVHFRHLPNGATVSGFRHGETLREEWEAHVYHKPHGKSYSEDNIIAAYPDEEHPNLLSVLAFVGCEHDVGPARLTPERARKLAGYLRDWADYQEGQHEQPKDLG